LTGTTRPSGKAGSDPVKRLEPAIPAHLRVPRTQPLHAPPGFTPVHASYSARFLQEMERVVIGYYGVQSPADDAGAEAAFERVKVALGAADGPTFWDVAFQMDVHGYANRLVAAYWTDGEAYRRWDERLGDDWWYRSLDAEGKIGAYREILQPSVWDAETTFSHPHADGLAKVADAMSGETDTHEYWGSARDRIARAQTDALEPRGWPSVHGLSTGQATMGRLITVTPHDNLCLLRSGQDWSDTEGPERAFYLTHVKPLLDAGMDELVKEGRTFGCYFNRYLTIEDGSRNERSYSMSAWHSLAALEAWVKADTHLKIWGAGIKHYKRAGNASRLRLYHELAVLKAEDQSFSYFNCHEHTGMLAASNSDVSPSQGSVAEA
jgi:aldoxime dehydratase